MRRILLLLCLLDSVLTAGASYDVVYWNTNFDSQFTPQYGQKILVSPIYFSNSIAPLQPKMYTCGIAGSTYAAGFIISNMLSGRYTFDIQSTPRSTPLIFVVPDGSGTYTLSIADKVATPTGTGFPSYADITNYVNNHSSSGSATNLTPWTSDINGGGFSLTNANTVKADIAVVRSLAANGNATFANHGNAGSPLVVDEFNGTNNLAELYGTVSGRSVLISPNADITIGAGVYSGNGSGLTNLPGLTNTSYFGVGRWISATGNLSTALSSASAGDTILVGPGRYTNNNLLKPGVNWYFAPGSVLWYQQPTTNDAGWGLFDDRTSGATTNYIMGYADMYFLKGTNGSGTSGAYTWNLNTKGLMVVTNAHSDIHFQCRRMFMAGVDGLQIGAIQADNYYRLYVDVDEITDLWQGLTITLKDTDDGTDDYVSNVYGIGWGVGAEAHVNVRRINRMGGTYGLFGYDTLASDPGSHNAAVNFWFTGDFMDSKIYIACVSTNYRTWVSIKEISHEAPTSIYGSGKHYLTFNKLNSTATSSAAIDVNGNFAGGSNVVVWLTAQKVTSAGQWIGSNLGGNDSFSTVYANVLHYEDLGTMTTGFLASANSEIHINGGYAKLNSGVGIRHDGGNMFVDGLTIDNSGGVKSPVEVNASGLTLKNVRLTGPASTNSIGANSAQTVKIWSGVTANQVVNANVTLTPPALFQTDASTYPVTNLDSRVLVFTNNHAVSNQTFAAGVSIGTNGTIGMSGAMTKYNGDSLSGNGLCSIVTNINWTGQTATIPTTNLYTVNTAGLFLVVAVMETTTAGSAGTVTLTWGWTDDVGATTASSSALALNAGGRVRPNLAPIYCAAGTVISWSTAVAGASGSPQYAVKMDIIRW